MSERVFRGEGRLTIAERLGGKAVLLPFVIALAVVIGIAAVNAPPINDPLRWLPLVAGAAVPIWYGHRVGMWRAALGMLRGEPSLLWRVEVDELEIRQTVEQKDESSFEWFEIERFNLVELGIVLWLRVPKDGGNAIILPRRFFPSEEWDPLVALVREKLPSSAKAHDEAKRVSETTRRNNLRWTFVFWFALVAVMAGIWFLVRGTA
jgi:hypothetical protein